MATVGSTINSEVCIFWLPHSFDNIIESLEVSKRRGNIGGGWHWNNQIFSWAAYQLLLNQFNTQIPFLITGQDINIIIELNPWQNIRMMFIRRNKNSRFLILPFNRLQNLKSLLNSSSRPTACRQSHKFLVVSAERSKEAIMSISHHLGRIFYIERKVLPKWLNSVWGLAANLLA